MKTIMALAVLCLAPPAIQAGTLLFINFDTSNFANFVSYTYQETGTSSFANNGGTPTAGGGTSGTAGAVTTFNTTGASGQFAGFGTEIAAAPININDISGAGSLRDFTFAIDLRVGGITRFAPPLNFVLRFEAPDNSILPADGDTDPDILLNLRDSRGATSAYQTLTTTLADWTVNRGSLALLKSNLGALNNISLNIGYDDTGALPEFGHDADNVLAADNYSLFVVPEAGSAALCLLGLGTFRIRRRR